MARTGIRSLLSVLLNAFLDASSPAGVLRLTYAFPAPVSANPTSTSASASGTRMPSPMSTLMMEDAELSSPVCDGRSPGDKLLM